MSVYGLLASRKTVHLILETLSPSKKGIHEMPRFTHDCDVCAFLGEDKKNDFYFCARCDEGTVIARYGSEGQEYFSAPVWAVYRVLKEGMGDLCGKHLEPSDPRIQNWVLVVALRMAEKAGLLPGKE